MSSVLRINSVTRKDREAMIARARAAIVECGGWILDVKMFSNVAVCFTFEIPPTRIERLREALAATGLRLSKESIDSFSSLPRGLEDSNVENLTGSLQITFVHNDPDLRIEVPPIPG